MKFLPIVLLLFAAQTLTPPANAAEPDKAQEKAIAAIKDLGGDVMIDRKRK